MIFKKIMILLCAVLIYARLNCAERSIKFGFQPIEKYNEKGESVELFDPSELKGLSFFELTEMLWKYPRNHILYKAIFADIEKNANQNGIDFAVRESASSLFNRCILSNDDIKWFFDNELIKYFPEGNLRDYMIRWIERYVFDCPLDYSFLINCFETLLRYEEVNIASLKSIAHISLEWYMPFFEQLVEKFGYENVLFVCELIKFTIKIDVYLTRDEKDRLMYFATELEDITQEWMQINHKKMLEEQCEDLSECVPPVDDYGWVTPEMVYPESSEKSDVIRQQENFGHDDEGDGWVTPEIVNS